MTPETTGRHCRCGASLEGRSPRARTCSQRCREAAHAARNPERRAAQKAAFKAKTLSYRVAMTPLWLKYNLPDWPCRVHGAPPLWGYCTLCVEDVCA